MGRNVERYNYRHQFEDCLPALLSKLQSMLLEGSYILSEEVRAFERAFAEFLGAGNAIGVNTGTYALAIVNSGARPVLVDADEKTFLMNQEQIASVITAATRALLPVHLYGKPVPMDHLLELSAKHEIHIVEDACQAHGAKWRGRQAGTLGHIGCFSFHPSKNLAAAGDGGMITTGSDLLAHKILRLRSLGQEGQNNHVVAGYNSRLDAIQAVILLNKLPSLELWNQQRRTIAAMYKERLQDLPLRFQEASPEEEHVYHLFQVRTDSRDQLLEHLRSNQIDAVIRYPVAIHLQPAFSSLGWKQGQFPVAEKLSQELLALPIRPDMAADEVDYVCDSARSFFKSNALRAGRAAGQ